MTEEKKCEACGVRRATVHLTQIIKDTVKKVHLCEECNQAQDPITPELLAALMPKAEEAVQANVGGTVAVQLDVEAASRTCASCGLSWADFKRGGRLGCPDDYRVFQEELQPVLAKLHGATRHVGQVPTNTDTTADLEVRVRTFKQELDQAIATEDYEAAARLRDQIRQLRGELHGAG
jgi:protein arginine kinase activator